MWNHLCDYFLLPKTQFLGAPSRSCKNIWWQNWTTLQIFRSVQIFVQITICFYSHRVHSLHYTFRILLRQVVHKFLSFIILLCYSKTELKLWALWRVYMLSDVEAMSTNHSGKGLTRYAIITFAEYSKIFMKFDSKRIWYSPMFMHQ